MSGTPPKCDGAADDGGPCENPLAVECECALCSHEEQNDRYHSCLAHRGRASAAHEHEHGGSAALWKVYEMARATQASPPPEAARPMCDGSPVGERPCQTPPSWECTCKRCARERDPSERYHACEAHKGAAADRHRDVRERPAEWSAYWPPERQAKPTLPTVSRDFTLPEEPQGGATGPILKWSTGTGPAAVPHCSEFPDDGARCAFGADYVVCVCTYCARLENHNNMFHACASHREMSAKRHLAATGLQVSWAPFRPVAPAPPSLAEEMAAQMGVVESLVYGPLGPSGKEIIVECHALARLLIAKNLKYGDSALNPRRVFAKADAVEQIKVRIDDKINRIEKGDASIEDEDVIQDLLGYLILLRIATKRKATASAKKDP